MHEFLKISPRISCLPVIHGSGDYAVAVRRALLNEKFDCLAVPLPPSFQPYVERGVELLPAVSVVVQEEDLPFQKTDWQSQQDAEESDGRPDRRVCSYVPIDPCQPVIAALRFALQERMHRAFIDMETEHFSPVAAVLPDPYALREVPVEKFSAAILPTIPRLPEGQPQQRALNMAARLRELEKTFDRILFLPSIIDWPWVREAYVEGFDAIIPDDPVIEPRLMKAHPAGLVFLLGELPFITSLYERARQELDDDENLSVDGVKEMLLTARERYREELKHRARKITPHMLRTYLKYARNLSLIERRMTPDLYTLIISAQQIAGDQFAIHVAETAREYAYTPASGETTYGPQGDPLPTDVFTMGVGHGAMPDGELVDVVSRLPGHPVTWRTCQLSRRPPEIDQEQWKLAWNPFHQCSWPPEDVAIERFRTHVKDHALQLLGQDLARTEKFSTSMMDGLDIRETLRNWHTGDLYVKIHPPSRGSLDCVLMLFDSPADPREYPWRITWHAEHHDESTLAFFATHYGAEVVGPGIASATYGGAMFLFPPRPVSDIWTDRRFDFTDTIEERLLAAALHYSREKHIALLSHAPPGAGWRRLAKRYGKKLVHVPLAHFSQETVQQLRIFHVLNGRHVRSYADHFIRKS